MYATDSLSTLSRIFYRQDYAFSDSRFRKTLIINGLEDSCLAIPCRSEFD